MRCDIHNKRVKGGPFIQDKIVVLYYGNFKFTILPIPSHGPIAMSGNELEEQCLGKESSWSDTWIFRLHPWPFCLQTEFAVNINQMQTHFIKPFFHYLLSLVIISKIHFCRGRNVQRYSNLTYCPVKMAHTFIYDINYLQLSNASLLQWVYIL